MDEQFNTELCRCCLTDGSYKNLTETFQWMGEDEVYGDMLKDCFDVMICDSSIGGICDVCITQLRNASNFKKQVLQSEQKFKKKLEISLKGDTVKIEHVCENDQDSDTIDQDSYFEVLEAEMEVPIKEEVAIETKSRKRGMKLVKNETKAKRSKQDPETSTKGKLRITEKAKEMRWSDRGKQTPEELDKRYHNLLTILESTNATPIQRKTGRGFHCVFCPEVTIYPGELKIHTLKDHQDFKVKHKSFKEMLYADSVKLDITSLECSLCDTRMEDLFDFSEHLNSEHDMKLHTDIKDRIIPFKFDKPDAARCMFCSQTFVSFNMLLRHMNIHFRYHICKVCEAGFLTERLLRFHMRGSHGKGEFQCGLCEKVFGTIHKKREHERTVHFGFKRNKCPYCPERFAYYSKRNTHIAEVHDKPLVVYECHACVRTFDTRANLSRHIKRDHLMEKPYSCTECDMKFFKGTCLKRHMVKHTGQKDYGCDVCLKMFGRKKTLREHMRIHNNDRRFKCVVCKQAFVQKCAWRSHMRSKHSVPYP